MLKNITLIVTVLAIFVGCGGDKSKDSDEKENRDSSSDLFQPIPTEQTTTPIPVATRQPIETKVRFTRDSQKQVVIDNEEQIMWQDDIRAKEIKACWLTDPDFLDCQAGMPQQHRPSCDNYNSMERCSGEFTVLPRYTAYKECSNLTLGGYSDWHVPTLNDLSSIVDTTREKAPFINPIFENTTSLQYWSSTSIDRTASLAWVIFFGNRETSHVKFDKNTEVGIRCVRDIN